jgi:hypothetical protein
MSEADPTATDEPVQDELPGKQDADGDDGIHKPGDGTEKPPEPGAGLGEAVEEPDPENE